MILLYIFYGILITQCLCAKGLDTSFVENVKGIKFKMIKIPNKNYYVAECEVTQELWQAITGETPSQYQNCPKCPVESITYIDITQNFLPKLNQITNKKYRLPSYKEWFFASLGGESFKESEKENINEISWNYENSKLTPQIVMTKQPNKYGLYDMLGNVQEWTAEQIEGYQKRIIYMALGGDWSDQGFRIIENKYWTFPPHEYDEGTGMRLFLSLE